MLNIKEYINKDNILDNDNEYQEWLEERRKETREALMQDIEFLKNDLNDSEYIY